MVWYMAVFYWTSALFHWIKRCLKIGSVFYWVSARFHWLKTWFETCLCPLTLALVYCIDLNQHGLKLGLVFYWASTSFHWLKKNIVWNLTPSFYCASALLYRLALSFTEPHFIPLNENKTWFETWLCLFTVPLLSSIDLKQEQGLKLGMSFYCAFTLFNWIKTNHGLKLGSVFNCAFYLVQFN